MEMSFRSRLAYITRGKINFCAVKFYAAMSPPSRLPSYLLSYRSVFSNALEFRQSYVLMQNLFACRRLRRMKFCRPSQAARGIYLPRFVLNEILPLAARRAVFTCRTCMSSPYPLAASCRFTNVHRCRLSPTSSRIFLCLVSCASPHLRQDHAVPLKHANLSYIKFRFFAVLASCRTLSCLSAASRRRAVSLPALAVPAASFSARVLKFQPKSSIPHRVLAETISPLVRRRGLNFVLRSLFPSRAQGSSVHLGCKKMRLCLARYSHRHRARCRLPARLRARRSARRSLRHRKGFCPSSFENRAFLHL